MTYYGIRYKGFRLHRIILWPILETVLICLKYSLRRKIFIFFPLFQSDSATSLVKAVESEVFHSQPSTRTECNRTCSDCRGERQEKNLLLIFKQTNQNSFLTVLNAINRHIAPLSKMFSLLLRISTCIALILTLIFDCFRRKYLIIIDVGKSLLGESQKM